MNKFKKYKKYYELDHRAIRATLNHRTNKGNTRNAPNYKQLENWELLAKNKAETRNLKKTNKLEHIEQWEHIENIEQEIKRVGTDSKHNTTWQNETKHKKYEQDKRINANRTIGKIWHMEEEKNYNE